MAKIFVERQRLQGFSSDKQIVCLRPLRVKIGLVLHRRLCRWRCLGRESADESDEEDDHQTEAVSHRQPPKPSSNILSTRALACESLSPPRVTRNHFCKCRLRLPGLKAGDRQVNDSYTPPGGSLIFFGCRTLRFLKGAVLDVA